MATRQVPSPEAMDAAGRPPSAVTFRPLRLRDLDHVLALERRTFSTPWDAGAFRAFLRPGAAFSLVAVAGETIMGYALGWCEPPEAELMNLAVDAAWRRRGTGWALLDRSLEICARRGARELFLEVRVSNAAAQRLYLRHGFEACGRRRDYYANPREDALVYRARLGASPGAARECD